jgi:hypothetical protein
MAQQRDYMFVLWADRFDESAAAVFVTEFRIAGLRTKLVSLVGHASAGSFGLALAPDLTLDQALPLAGRAACVVIPGGAAAIRRAGADPRLRDFVAQAHARGALFVVGRDGEGALGGLLGGGVAPPAVQTLPGRADLVECAGRVARRWMPDFTSTSSVLGSLPAPL